MSRTYLFTIRNTHTDKLNVHGIIGISDHEEVASLDSVDRFIAEWWGEPIDDKWYCPHMDSAVEVGFCALLNEGGCFIGEEGTRRARTKKEYPHLKADEPARPHDHLGYLMRIDWHRKPDEMNEEEALAYEVKEARFKAFLHHLFFVKYRFHAYG